MKENHQIQTELNNINLFYANTVNQPVFHTKEPWDLGSSAEWWHEYFAHLHDWFAHQSAYGWKPQVKGFLHIYGETKKIFCYELQDIYRKPYSYWTGSAYADTTG